MFNFGRYAEICHLPLTSLWELNFPWLILKFPDLLKCPLRVKELIFLAWQHVTHYYFEEIRNTDVLFELFSRRPAIINFCYVWLKTQLCLWIRLLYINIYFYLGWFWGSKCFENCKRKFCFFGVLQRSFGGKSSPARISTHLMCLLFDVICTGNCSWNILSQTMNKHISVNKHVGCKVCVAWKHKMFHDVTLHDVIGGQQDICE